MHAKIIATVVVVLGAAGALFFSSFDDVEYYEHVHKVVANPQKWQGKNLQVHGYAVPGTIKEQIVDQKAQRTFEIEYCGKTLPVRHAGSKPDTFKDQAETVVKGKLLLVNGEPVFQAVEGENGIMAKCPSKYEGNREAPKCDGI
jgi:cytochrome c-type biogenesis protein CcmE